ncbi:AAA family ATPase [Nitrosomonas aestuarii]|uniref:AAA family ATPase n=1 Tax=Nitrosomonas aestuarii TaxID=52441 RepID=UPI000D3077E8|nr:AAA family ATPase [Nitrosomonas aestuarii]PTN11859.1 AAA domain-containing protein [Nitrosomonas aestuarii]
MIRAEYFRFLQTLNAQSVPADVRKIANLVLQHLGTLIPLSTAQGQRIKKIVKLAQENWSSVGTDIDPPSEQVTEQTCPIIQLKSISVGPFRGFAKQEDLDLDSKLVLIYGPNGTGKSSFCEALEYGLLGNVAEAESKRFRNQQDYLKNAYTEGFTPPTLVGIDNQGNDILITRNELLYRFCFVEKNRIDNFSRIAAQAPAKQAELISTLFGLDAFTEFVRNFSDTMDGRYIDLEGVKTKELGKKREVLAGYQQQLKTTIPEEIQNIEKDERDLVQEYREGCSFSQMITELNGTEEQIGMIKQLENEVQKQLPSKNNVTSYSLDTLKQSIETNINQLESKQDALSRASHQVSFKQLYDAVTQLKESSPESCPACQTPLSQAKVNPFDYADAELKKLEHLSRLQDELQTLKRDIVTSLNSLSVMINVCCSHYPENNPLTAIQITDGKAITIDWWHSLLQNPGAELTPLLHLENQVKQLEELDKAIDTDAAERIEKQAKLTRLRELTERIVKLQTRSETANTTKNKAEEAIAKFDAENTQLIENSEAEKTVVVQNQAIADAYAIFVQKLNAYINGLPATLVADLGETVVQLYNAFNRNDSEHEQLASIRFPLNQNQRLQITFKKNPGRYFDALHILSEGHIRCVGLAILTAKNLKENCPLLIFDDPVNAIDDDHRESIRKTLFEDSFFNNKQIILACHGEEFFKDIQNLLSVEKASQSKTVSFLPKTGDIHILVDLNCSSRNYIIAASSHYDRNEIRGALVKSRQALESLTKGKVWRYVNRYGDGNLSIKLRSATAPIELRNLTEQLKAKINKADFSDGNKTDVLTPIESLLSVRGDSREWRYLNKGVHEETDRAEFDRQTVNQIITGLKGLDAALKVQEAQ